MKYVFFVILSAFFAFSSCKKANNHSGTEADLPSEEKKYAYLPIKFEMATSLLTLTYKGNTTLLSEIADDQGHKTVISYTGEQRLLKLEKFNDEKLFYVVYYESSDKKTIGAAQTFDYNPVNMRYTPLSSYHLFYDKQQQIRTINYYEKNINLTKTLELSYSTSGNLSERTTTPVSGIRSILKYTFDQQRGICNQISHLGLLAFEAEHWFFLCTFNNIIDSTDQASPSEAINFKYEYNENGYPSMVTIHKNGQYQNIRITYKRIET